MTRNQVLVYHKIDNKPELGLSVIPPRKFRRQIEFLLTKGYRFYTLSDLQRQSDPHNKIAITFDDGYQDVYQNAFPILKEYQIPATVFVISSYLGKENRWDTNLGILRFQHLDCKELQHLLTAGWEIGSHGLDHHCLLGHTAAAVRQQLAASKRILEHTLACEINYFAAPFGRINPRITQIARQVGYRGICGFYPWTYYQHRQNHYQIPRLAVYYFDSLKALEHKLAPDRRLVVEILKQQIISLCANGTILVNALR